MSRVSDGQASLHARRPLQLTKWAAIHTFSTKKNEHVVHHNANRSKPRRRENKILDIIILHRLPQKISPGCPLSIHKSERERLETESLTIHPLVVTFWPRAIRALVYQFPSHTRAKFAPWPCTLVPKMAGAPKSPASPLNYKNRLFNETLQRNVFLSSFSAHFSHSVPTSLGGNIGFGPSNLPMGTTMACEFQSTIRTTHK